MPWRGRRPRPCEAARLRPRIRLTAEARPGPPPATDLLLDPAPAAPGTAEGQRTPLRLPLDRGRFLTLASLAATLRTLRARLPVGGRTHRRVAALAGEIEARVAELARIDALASLDAASMASTGTLAALRRVSRDNLPMSTLLDRAARTLRDALEELGVGRVLVGPVADVDRASLKVYARAALLSTRTAWSWSERTGPGEARGEAGARSPREGWLRSRAQIVRRVGALAGETLSAVPAGPPQAVEVTSLAGACILLTDMNYDACSLWISQALNDPLPEDPDVHRFAALLATSTGLDTEAEVHLRSAYGCAAWPTKRANIAYALALIWAKRLHDLDRSDRWLAVAMGHAEERAAGDPGDPAVEQGWILNGYALNALLRARVRTGSSKPAFRETFGYVREAFRRVEHGDDPERVYLRFNLLGNMSTLLAIEGQWDHALRLLDEAFMPLFETFDDADLAHLQSERAALLARSGRPGEALSLYRTARDALLGDDRPVCAERLNRSVGTLERRLGRLADAEATFADGVRRALEARSRQALTVNAGGLAVCLVEQGRDREAGDAVALAASEGVALGDPELAGSERLRSVPPPEGLTGLSTSLPEVDLEHQPPASIAGALRGSDRDLRVLRAAR